MRNLFWIILLCGSMLAEGCGNELTRSIVEIIKRGALNTDEAGEIKTFPEFEMLLKNDEAFENTQNYHLNKSLGDFDPQYMQEYMYFRNIPFLHAMIDYLNRLQRSRLSTSTRLSPLLAEFKYNLHIVWNNVLRHLQKTESNRHSSRTTSDLFSINDSTKCEKNSVFANENIKNGCNSGNSKNDELNPKGNECGRVKKNNDPAHNRRVKTYQSLCPAKRTSVSLQTPIYEYRPNHYTQITCENTHPPDLEDVANKNKICSEAGFACIQLNRTIHLIRRPKNGFRDCWESEVRVIPSGCECMWPRHNFGDIVAYHANDKRFTPNLHNILYDTHFN